mmetsp:Transcript_1734/g.3941  ORF Transcript_1734/g.3941 Transcript_1734/m.3941 type:complete len:358 (+) Transcript_1734:697-1770(+)
MLDEGAETRKEARKEVGKHLAGDVREVEGGGRRRAVGVSSLGRRLDQLMPGLDERAVLVVSSDWHEVAVRNVSAVRVDARPDLHHALHLAHLVGGARVDGVGDEEPRLLSEPHAILAREGPQPPLGPVLDPRVRVDGLMVPSCLGHHFVDSWVLLDAFGRDANALHGLGLFLGLHRVSRYHLHSAVHARVSAEGMEHVPDPSALLDGRWSSQVPPLPHRKHVGEEVEDDHLPLRHPVEVGVQLRLLPEPRVVHEEPSLHQPDGLGVCSLHRREHRARGGREKVQRDLAAGSWPVLIEGVARVDMVRAIRPSHLLHKRLAYAFEERVGRRHLHHAAVVPVEPAPVPVSGELRLRVEVR